MSTLRLRHLYARVRRAFCRELGSVRGNYYHSLCSPDFFSEGGGTSVHRLLFIYYLMVSFISTSLIDTIIYYISAVLNTQSYKYLCFFFYLSLISCDVTELLVHVDGAFQTFFSSFSFHFRAPPPRSLLCPLAVI